MIYGNILQLSFVLHLIQWDLYKASTFALKTVSALWMYGLIESFPKTQLFRKYGNRKEIRTNKKNVLEGFTCDIRILSHNTLLFFVFFH